MIAPVSFFRREVTTLWATTYQFDLKLFDQFLLRRLGNPPLDAVVLADEACVTDQLLCLTDVDRRVAANANSRYLLRGIRPRSGGRFHPKTYFFHSRGGSRLLVGSGNLTRAGLDRGRETFAAFDAQDAEGAAVIRAWAAWIGELVLERDDPLLRARYERLRATLPAESAAAGEASPFATNGTTPLIETIARRSPPEVAELHLTAPYLDPRAEAVAQLIERLDPSRRVHLYLGARTSVDAAALRDVLAGARCEVAISRYDPPAFVHAKLIGIIGAGGDGVLVCGSANLSQAALIRTSSTSNSWGNVEAVVLRNGTAQQVVDAFRAPEAMLVACSLDELPGLTAEPEDEERETPPTVRLLHAVFAEDRRIIVHAEPPAAGLLVSLDIDVPPLALDADGGATMTPVAAEHQPLVVRLVDALGVARSNAVVLDDPAALEQMLAERGHGADRPHELDDLAESSELVGLLAWAHRRMIFDLDDTPEARRAANAQEQQSDAEDTGFFERYVREELVYDTRSQSYRRPSDRHELTTTDLLLGEIEAMLHAAPGERRLRLLRDDDSAQPEADREPGGGRSWTTTARERVRATNLLRRWARALADPRHIWLSEEAPARNYEALIELLAVIWLREMLDDERMAELLGEMWSALLGSDERQGLLDRIEEPLRQHLLRALHEPVRDLAAGLACCCMHPDMPWTDYVYAWQPFLVRGLEAGVFVPGERACEMVAALFPGECTTVSEIEDRLLARATWVDDETWGRQTAEALGVANVQLIAHTRYKDVHAAVRVDGLADPARDPRVVVLARRTMAFRKTDNVLVQAGEQRFLLRIGETARALIDGHVRSSPGPLDRARLHAVERQQGSLADLLAS